MNLVNFLNIQSVWEFFRTIINPLRSEDCGQREYLSKRTSLRICFREV